MLLLFFVNAFLAPVSALPPRPKTTQDHLLETSLSEADQLELLSGAVHKQGCNLERCHKFFKKNQGDEFTVCLKRPECGDVSGIPPNKMERDSHA